jgi:16S rRNA (guanine527-N7)-methyltransferase
MNEILEYFPSLSPWQIQCFNKLGDLYRDWNQKINVISRQDIEHLYTRHVLHSLAIAKILNFRPGTAVMDVGTGGGFPGIPLAIFFPDTNFVLVDSIGKKIKVVKGIADELELKNVKALNTRVEGVKEKFDFIVSRAVTAFPAFVGLVEKNILSNGRNSIPNGILYLKGGELQEELKSFHGLVEIYEISSFFKDPFFETKKVVFLPFPGKKSIKIN